MSYIWLPLTVLAVIFAVYCIEAAADPYSSAPEWIKTLGSIFAIMAAFYMIFCIATIGHVLVTKG